MATQEMGIENELMTYKSPGHRKVSWEETVSVRGGHCKLEHQSSAHVLPKIIIGSQIIYESCPTIYFSLSTLGHGEHPKVTPVIADLRNKQTNSI